MTDKPPKRCSSIHPTVLARCEKDADHIHGDRVTRVHRATHPNSAYVWTEHR